MLAGGLYCPGNLAAGPCPVSMITEKITALSTFYVGLNPPVYLAIQFTNHMSITFMYVLWSYCDLQLSFS